MATFFGPIGTFLMTVMPRFSCPSTIYDGSRPYLLPYEGNCFDAQGYNGNCSHQGDKAIDFLMNEGTPILASRSGTVSYVVDGNSVACPDTGGCDWNVVYIEHDDGTTARYGHMKLNGTCVTVGQSIQQGDVIGLSGNTGYSWAPHLHFDVRDADSVDQDTPFADVGDNSGIPMAGCYYTSGNKIKTNYCTLKMCSRNLRGRSDSKIGEELGRQWWWEDYLR